MNQSLSEKSYEEAINLLTSQGKFYIKLGLERVSKVLSFLGNPQESLKVVHVAGTNGKGSTCALLESALRANGYKTGLYTSPHLIDYTERIKINGIDIDQKDFAGLLFKIVEISDKQKIHLTEFEILTVMAFLYFQEQKVDVVILETGLGGRLDATNVVKKPLVSVITSIDFDHVDRLGDTIEKIAIEKSGIIKPNTHVISLDDNKGIDTIKKIVQEKKAHFSSVVKFPCLIDKNQNLYEFKDFQFKMPLLGLWQKYNLGLVFKTLEILNIKDFKLNKNNIIKGVENTKWQGRMQFFPEFNLIIDGAHNVSSAKLLKQSLDLYFPNKKRLWLYGSLKSKNYKLIIKELFNDGDTVFCTKSSFVSAENPRILKEVILSNFNNCNVTECESIKKYVNNFYTKSNGDSVRIIAGSLYLAGEALSLLGNKTP